MCKRGVIQIVARQFELHPIWNMNFFCFVLLLMPLSILAQETDYRIYHRLINRAEEHFYLKNQTDSAFYYYDKAFANFDYVFAKDAMNAVQLALYSKKNFQHYLVKGYENGLRPDYFRNIKLTQGLYAQLLVDTNMIRSYQSARANYLKKINFQYLQTIYDMAMEDQIMKNKGDLAYAEYKKQCTHAIRSYIKRFGGFPGTKLLGISDSTVFREIGFPNFDWNKRLQRYGGKIDYYKIEDHLCSKFIVILMVHNGCFFPELEQELRMAVKNGEIHPREVGLVYDGMYRPNHSKFLL